MSDDVPTVIRDYLIAECFPGEDPARLTPELPLISGRLIDSIALLKLVSFLEQRFAVSIAPHEAGVEHLDTIERISRLVASKRAAR